MNPKYMMLIMVAIAVVCALFAWYKRCPPKVIIIEDPPTPEPEPEPELDESEERLYQYLETESKERTIDISDTVKDLFDVNEVPLNDPVMFVRTVREWDRSVRKLAQKDAEAMYNNINSLNIDSELFDTVINEHVSPCDTVLFKRILKQLTDDAIKGQLFTVLF